ncbi:SHOCT domain-containing protein [Salinigranum sp.]|uniref:SHOCT domain-containing protein n=1 Tax=Salinigranum sp. TaxID=1966351 RepID=UPI00356A206A
MRASTPPVDGWSSPPAGERRTVLLIGLTTLAILAVAFGAMALGVSYFWVVFPVGFGGVLPLVVAYGHRTDGADRDRESATNASAETTSPAAAGQDEALRTLRARYARGELTDEAFETRLERLLETESVANAANRVRRPRSAGDDRGGEGGQRD